MPCSRLLTIVLFLFAHNVVASDILRPLTTLSGHVAPAHRLVISPSSDRAAFAVESYVYLYNLGKRQLGASWAVGNSNVRDLAFSPDGRRLVTAVDHTVTVWDVETHKALRTFEKHPSTLLRARFWKDANTVLSLDYDDLLIAWQVDTGAVLWHLVLPKYAASEFLLSPDGKYLATGGDEAYLVDLDAHRVLFRLSAGRVDGAKALEAYPVGFSGPSLVTKDLHYGFQVWDTASGRLERSFRPSKAGVEEAVVTAAGNLLSVDDAGWLSSTSLKTFVTEKTMKLSEPSISTQMTVNTAATLLGYSTNDGVQIIDLKTNASYNVTVPSPKVDALAFLQGGKQVVTAAGNTLNIWDLTDFSLVKEIRLQDAGVKNLVYRRMIDGYFVLVQTYTGVTKVNLATGEETPYLQSPGTPLSSLAAGGERSVLAIGTTTNAVLWDTDAERVTHTYNVPATGDAISATMSNLFGSWEVRLSPDRTTLLTLSEIDGRSTLSLWDRVEESVTSSLVPLSAAAEASKYEPERTLWLDRFTDAAFLHAGTQIAASMWLSGLRLYDTTTKQDLWVYSEEGVFRLAPSPDEQIIAALTLSGRVILLDSQTGEVRASAAGHTAASTLSFSPDGRYLVVGSGSVDAPGTVALYDMTTVVRP